MTRSRRELPGRSIARRVALGVALAVVTQGCAVGTGLPRIRPGSNISLPQPGPNPLVDYLLGGCDEPSASPRTPARDVVDCRRDGAIGGTVVDPRPVGSPKAP